MTIAEAAKALAKECPRKFSEYSHEATFRHYHDPRNLEGPMCLYHMVQPPPGFTRTPAQVELDALTGSKTPTPSQPGMFGG